MIKKIFILTSLLLSNSKLVVDPELYNKTSNQQYELASDVLDNLNLQGNENILDVGCGDGKITYELAKKVPYGKVVGIDASIDMISYGKTKYESKIDNLSFYHEKAEEINLNEKFDYIVSFSAFLWFDNPEKAFHSLVKKLKKGGKLIIITPTKESCDWVYYEKALDDPRWSNYKSKSKYHKMLKASDYLSLAKENALTVVKYKYCRYHYYMSNLSDFKEYVRSWLFCYIHLPPSFVDSYLDVLVKEGSSQFFIKNDNSILIPYDAMTLVLENS